MIQHESLKFKFQNEGILFPIPALNENEIVEAQQQYLKLCSPGKVVIEGESRVFGHLVHPWIAKLVSHPAILETVNILIGPNILVWVSEFNTKAPGTPNYFSWHQDLYYWGHKYEKDIRTIPMVTVWLSIFTADALSGCMRVIPGSHTHLREHRENTNANNMLTRGQEIVVEVNEEKAIHVELQAGEFSIHHPLIHHASGPNMSSHCRVGLVIRYLAPEIAPPIRPAYAWLVSGEDSEMKWDHVAPMSFLTGNASHELRRKSMNSVQACTGARFK